MKPLIGITANYIKDDRFGVDAHIGGAGQCWQALADDYTRSVVKAGGIPVILPVVASLEEVADWLDQLDGVLFSGGCDLSPLTYRADTTAKVGEICQDRDQQELAMMKAALARPDYPILSICRGCQLLNVALDGSLVVDIDTSVSGEHFFPNQRMAVPTHTVKVEQGSRISNLLGTERRVNSYHHQCVDKPGTGVHITARDAHGVPECIEVPAREGFTLGVQWHPEGLAGSYEGHLNIFKAFVAAAEQYKNGR